LDRLEQISELFGINIVRISEKCTSQVHYEIGLFGYRKKDYLYHYDKDDVLQKVDADINAAKNILNKAATRHANNMLYSWKGIKNKEINKEEESEDTDGKSIGTLGKRDAGSLYKIFNYSNEKSKTAKQALKEIEEYFEKIKNRGNEDPKIIETNYFRKHGDSWLTDFEHRALKNKIEEEVKNLITETSDGVVSKTLEPLEVFKLQDFTIENWSESNSIEATKIDPLER